MSDLHKTVWTTCFRRGSADVKHKRENDKVKSTKDGSGSGFEPIRSRGEAENKRPAREGDPNGKRLYG